jgi:hypothetical protein
MTPPPSSAPAALPQVESEAPHASTLCLLALIAVAVRVAYTLVAAKLRHLSLADIPFYGDGWEVVAYARWLAGQGPIPPEGSTRQFPGLPATLALLLLARVPLTLATLAFHWLMAAVFTTATAALYRDWRVGLACALLLPDLLLCTAGVNANESPMLACTALGLLAATRGRAVTGGLLLGLAGAYRPMACFAVLGYLAYAACRRDWRRAAVVAVLSAGVVGVALLGMKWIWGDPLKGARVYANHPAGFNGQMFAWPFTSLVFTPFYYRVKAVKLVLDWAHALLLFAACALLVRRVASQRRTPLDVLSLVWLLGNTLFVLSMGGIWGFMGFPRYIVPGVPPMFAALRPCLPRRGWIWTLLAAASFVVAVAIFVKRGELPA